MVLEINPNMTYEQAGKWLTSVLFSEDPADLEQYRAFRKANPDWLKRYTSEQRHGLGVIMGDIFSNLLESGTNSVIADRSLTFAQAQALVTEAAQSTERREALFAFIQQNPDWMTGFTLEQQAELGMVIGDLTSAWLAERERMTNSVE